MSGRMEAFKDKWWGTNIQIEKDFRDAPNPAAGNLERRSEEIITADCTIATRAYDVLRGNGKQGLSEEQWGIYRSVVEGSDGGFHHTSQWGWWSGN